MRNVLRARDVRLLLLAGVVSQTGDWAPRIGVGYQVYALTGVNGGLGGGHVRLTGTAGAARLGRWASALAR